VRSVQQEIMRTATFARQHAATARARREHDFARRFERLAASAEQLAETLAHHPPSAAESEPQIHASMRRN
jgi:cystathionine beta-lyase/cystathionine gamma-synthase